MLVTKTLREFTNILMGRSVVVEDDKGDMFTGVLCKCSDELEIELKFAQKMPILEESKFVLFSDETIKSLKLKVVRLTGDFTPKDSGIAFRTDSEIAMNGDFESDKEFQPWEDDGDHCMEELGGFNETEYKLSKRCKKSRKNNASAFPVDEMFLANKDKCVGESSYDENLSQYSNVEIGKHTKEEQERANEIAKQIENNPNSIHHAILENDDEERDLDAITKFEEEAPEHNNEIVEHEHNNEIQEHENEQECDTEIILNSKTAITDEHEETEDNSNIQIEQDEQEDSKRFTFNPNAMPFVPKTKDLNSNHINNTNNSQAPLAAAAPVVPTAAFTSNNLMSSQISTLIHMPTMVPVQSAQITNAIPHPNIVYNNPVVYPHQPQTMVQSAVPLYAYAGNGVHQPTVFLPAANTAYLIQQQNISQQQQHYIPVSSSSAHANQNYSHGSRTATPTNGSTIHQIQQQQTQQLNDTTTTNATVIQQATPQTNVFHNQQIQAVQTPAGQVISGVHNVLPLMNIPQLPPHSVLQQANNVNTYPQQIPLLNGGTYVQHQQHFIHTPQTQHNPPQSHALVRNPAMQAQQYFQQSSIHQLNNNQQSQGIYAASTYGQHSLMQQPQQYQMPSYYIAPQNSNLMLPSVSMPPPLTLQLANAPPAHAPNIVGRQPQQQQH